MNKNLSFASLKENSERFCSIFPDPMIAKSYSMADTVSAYAGSLFVGHCNEDDLVEHYNHFVDKLELKSDYLLHLGMDGPNVNLSFENKLESNLESINTSFLRIGTCSLHLTHTAFRKGIKSLYLNSINILREKESTFDLDDFFNDSHFFFKLSSVRQEDCASSHTIC